MARTAGNIWHIAVLGECNGICESETHDPRCDGYAAEAHHIVFRSHLTKPAMWIRANGIALSQYCHLLAHASHNANIKQSRLDHAVRAVNLVQGCDPMYPEFEIPYFFKKTSA